MYTLYLYLIFIFHSHASGSVVFFLAPPVVPSLLHLSRMSVRRTMGDVTSRDDVNLPRTLKPYLQYKQW